MGCGCASCPICDRAAHLSSSARATETALEFSPDGKLLAVDTEGKVQVLDTEAQLAVVFETARPSGAVLLRFAPDGKSIAAAGKSDTTVHVWNLSDKQPVATLATRGTVVDIAIAADSTRLAASLNDGTSQVWQLPAGEPLALLSHTGRLVFVGNGSTVLTVGDRGTDPPVGVERASGNGTARQLVARDIHLQPKRVDARCRAGCGIGRQLDLALARRR
jgi:WD40 repeat protein